jgi:hypothetical protein
MIRLVLAGHTHQHMNEADAAGDDDMRPIRTMSAKRVGRALKFGTAYRLVVEAQ